MSQFRSRSAVSPLRRRIERVQTLPLIDDIVRVERPSEPMHCLRPATITATARRFVAAFPGTVMYAVKCNPEPAVLRALWAGGVRHFDCASAAEVSLVRTMFADADIHFMHPIKSRPAIREAFGMHGVRDFVIDSAEELAKVLDETNGGGGVLGLVVRLALPAGGARYDLSGKFGAPMEQAAELLRAARPHAARLGLSFHVGSQCVDPLAWRHALDQAGQAIRLSGVPVEIVDVGGGFPVSYPDMEPPELDRFIAEINSARAEFIPLGTAIWAEPGRALVAAGTSVVVQVQHRRGDTLYVNDGVYGSLSDAGAPGFRFPARLLPADGRAVAGPELDFAFFGPTCDSADRMRGPFPLPACVREGDWIEIGHWGPTAPACAPASTASTAPG